MPYNTETIKIKYLPESPSLVINENGNWIDLYTYEDISLHAGDFALINLGISMQLPQGYEAIIAPRSSTFKRYGLLQTNSIGIIDNSYCGDGDVWMMPVYATRDVAITKGTRLCQFRIFKNQPSISFQPVETLNNANRSGFGSSGI